MNPLWFLGLPPLHQQKTPACSVCLSADVAIHHLIGKGPGLPFESSEISEPDF